MDGGKAAGSVFMCRLCNLFSPSHSLLLAHCSQLHPQQEAPDDIITVLKPLLGEAAAENPVKRKRGRPKGSTKKTLSDRREDQDSAHSPEEDIRAEEEEEEEEEKKKKKEEADRRGENDSRTSGLECRDCHRMFRNRRQILKHICITEEEEEEEEEQERAEHREDADDNASVWGGGEDSENLDPGGSDTDHRPTRRATTKATARFPASRSHKKARLRSSVKAQLSTQPPTADTKKSVVSVVLTEDHVLPGVAKMVPVEDTAAGEHLAQPQQPQQQQQQQQQQPAHQENQSTDSPSNSTTEGEEQKQEREPGVNLTLVAQAAGRGFQEYSIKQEAKNLLQSQLKVFACDVCNKIFKFRHSLISHLRTHTQEKPFRCPHCDYASAIKANLNVHLRKHTGEKFSCQHCPFNCHSPGHLKVHIERVHLKMKQHCSFCQKKYADVKNLLQHMKQRHNLKDPNVNQVYQQLMLKTREGLRQLLYQCPTCNRRFKNQLERERHLLVHGPQRPFACQLCDHAATKMSALAAHVRRHPFLYVCAACDGKFISSQRLRAHLKESHPERHQEQAFAECIASSFCLMQPGEDLLGEEAGGGGAEGRGAQPGEEQRAADAEPAEPDGKEADPGREAAEGERIAVREGEQSQEAVAVGTEHPAQVQEEHGAAAPSADWTHTSAQAPPAQHTHRTQESAQPPAANTHTPASSSAVEESVRSAPTHTPSGKEPEVRHSAFQQVLLSLQKTQLDMETFYRLRKLYGDLECQYCGKLFWYKVHYNAHVRTHTKEHLHYCSKCSYSSITKSSLKRHLLQKHSGLLLTCPAPACQYATPDKYKLQAHQRTHQEEGRTEACPVCQQSYPEHKLKNHIKTSHPETVRSKGMKTRRAEKCPYCDSYFLKNSTDFQQHIWAHQGLKPYLCGLCDYAGRSRSNLKTHMDRHSQERSHVCDLCGKTFKSKVTLKSHRLSHSAEGKRFHCSQCDFTSVSKPALARHMEQHADFKPFRCAHCHYSCNIAGPLKRHYSRKHPDQMYQNAGPGLADPEALRQQGGLKCPECEFVYGTKWELNRHLKSKHGLKVVEGTWEVAETVEAHYVPMEDEEQMTEAHKATLQDDGAVNILQQITEFSSETQNAVTSVVAMAPGTVAVVEQLQVAEEKEVCGGEQLMVVNAAEADLGQNQVMVVEEGHGLEALTVLTQGDDTHHYIVYVQEHTIEIN